MMQTRFVRVLPRVGMALAVLVSMTPVSAAGTAQDLEEFLGSWEVETSLRGQTMTWTLTFTQSDDGALGGTWEGPRGKADLDDVAYEDGKITFTRARDGDRPAGIGRARGGDAPRGMAIEVTVEDGKLVGSIETPRGSREFTGVRVQT